MNRDQAIAIISQLYPADSIYPETAKIGQTLLEKARRDTAEWVNEPSHVLIRYAELCLDQEKITVVGTVS